MLKKLSVLGSANCDLYVELSRMPILGETLPAQAGGETRAGGKGANQSAAASQLGLFTYFLGQIGSDSAGSMLSSVLASRKVDLSHLTVLDSVPSGQAIVMLLPEGQNSIVIIGGANQHWQSFPESMHFPVEHSEALLLQREIPDIINFQAALVAKAQNKLVVLDAGGKMGAIPDEMLKTIDILSPNTLEIEEITGIKGDIEASAQFLLGKGVKHVVVKLSSQGSMYFGENGRYKQEVYQNESMKIVDTTGAGDCYTAALVVKILELGGKCELEDFKQAMMFASVAAFLSITQKGAMESMPTREDVEKLL